MEFMIEEDNMDDQFSKIASLIGEKVRAKILWHLLDGKAYTALELAIIGDISKQSCSNHLKKLVHANILKVEKQGRHRYFRLFNNQVASALEGLAFLTTEEKKKKKPIDARFEKNGIKYARSCYDHLAGYLGVAIKESFINQGLILEKNNQYDCTTKGILIFKKMGIETSELKTLKRKFAYPCLDWSERKHHIGGALGASLLAYMLANDWMRNKKHSRELMLTSKGHGELIKQFKLKG